MKKASGFEKFFKGKEKTGAAKKEQIRKEKREVRKEREDGIAQRKREKRAQQKASFAQGPRYRNEEGPQRVQKKFEQKNEGKPFRSDKKASAFKKEERPQQTKPLFNKNKHQQTEDTSKPFEKKPFKQREGQRSQVQNRNFKPQAHGHKHQDDNVARPFTKKPFKQADWQKPQAPPQKSNFKSQSPNHEPPTSNYKPQTTSNKPATTNRPPEEMPLNKYIAHSGLCSRRDAVDLIKGGKVKVNGELILEPGHKVLVSDDVKVAGKRLNPVKDFVYILLNKPKDYITTTDDPQQRKTVLDLLKGAPPARIYPVGRLDRNTSGVLLLTNDGELSQRLTHPSNEVKKVYAVTLDKPLTKHHFDEILKGVQLDDGPATVDVLAYTDAKDNTQLGVELHSGRNRIVRRIFEHFGYDVKALDRVVFAGLTKKNVNRGKWRFLTEREVRDLKFFKKGRG